jgi:hypothetical protein
MSIILPYFAENIRKNETYKENGTYGVDDESIEGFVGETRRKETI